MKISVRTWGSDYSELIDYEKENTSKTVLELSKNSILFRKYTDIFSSDKELPDNNDNDLSLEILSSFKITSNKCYFFPNLAIFNHKQKIQTPNTSWFILSPLFMNDKFCKYKLNKGDILRMGKMIVKIKDIRINMDSYKKKENDNINNNNKEKEDEPNETIKNYQNEVNKETINESNENNINDISNDTNNNYHSHINDINNNISSICKPTIPNSTTVEVRPNRRQKEPFLSSFPSQQQQSSFQNTNKYLNNSNNLNPKINDPKNFFNKDEITKEISFDTININKEREKSYLDLNDNDKDKGQKICRICYKKESENNYKNNYLICPCKCTGILKYIHIKCLKEEILKNQNFIKLEETDNYITYLMKPIICELCKSKIDDYFYIKSKKILALIDIFDFEDNIQFNDYLIMECFTSDKNKNKLLFIVSFDNKNFFKLGRSHTSDIKFNEVTMSRIHSKLKIDKNKNFFIEDNYSKFGTAILIQSKKIELSDGVPLFLQVGRSCLEMKIKGSFWGWCCCKGKGAVDYDFYYKQNFKGVFDNFHNYNKLIEIQKRGENDNSNNKNEDNKKKNNLRSDNNFNDINNIHEIADKNDNNNRNINSNRRINYSDTDYNLNTISDEDNKYLNNFNDNEMNNNIIINNKINNYMNKFEKISEIKENANENENEDEKIRNTIRKITKKLNDDDSSADVVNYSVKNDKKNNNNKSIDSEKTISHKDPSERKAKDKESEVENDDLFFIDKILED